MRKLILCLIATALIVLFIANILSPDGATLAPAAKEGSPAGVILSPMGIQRQLVELGYKIKVDGKLGPETMAAWNKAYGEQCHIENMRKAGQ